MTISNIDDFLKAKYSRVTISTLTSAGSPAAAFPELAGGSLSNDSKQICYNTNGNFYNTANTSYTGGDPISGSVHMGIAVRIPDPEPGKNKYFCGFSSMSSAINSSNGTSLYSFIDIVWVATGFSNRTGSIDINSRQFPSRDYSGLSTGYGYNAALFLKNTFSTTISSGATITYTNTENISSRTGVVLLRDNLFISNQNESLVNIALQPGDLGIKSIQNFNNQNTQFNGSIMVYRKLGQKVKLAGVGINADLNDLGLTEIYTGTSIAIVFDNGHQIPSIYGPSYLKFVEL